LTQRISVDGPASPRSPLAVAQNATTSERQHRAESRGSGAELPVATIDRASPVPFYFQLAELLEEEIVAGRWAPGARVPSENELGSRYGLSRTTIRQALARLEQEGLVSRKKGRGTFVADSRPRTWLIQSAEGFFHDEFLRAGHSVTSRVLRFERGKLPLWASDALALPAGEEGLIIERLRSVDGLVALYVVNCLPPFLADAVDGLEANESLYRRLAERRGITVVGGSRSLEAVSAGPKLAELLEFNAGDAVAYIESLMFDQNDRPIDCYRAWLRTDRMRLDITISAGRGSAALPSYLVSRAMP
jgi:GntR family transcriptional regulator